MNEAVPPPADGLANLVEPEVQRLAARMAQDAFTRIFRLTVERDDPALRAAVVEIGERARALRLALLVSGIEQWRIAYAQAFGLAAVPGIGALLDGLLSKLDAAADARWQQAFQYRKSALAVRRLAGLSRHWDYSPERQRRTTSYYLRNERTHRSQAPRKCWGRSAYDF